MKCFTHQKEEKKTIPLVPGLRHGVEVYPSRLESISGRNSFTFHHFDPSSF